MTWSGRLIFRGFLILSFLVSSFLPGGSILLDGRSNKNTYQLEVQTLLDQLSPEEKVGQLFLVGFSGNQITTTSKIYDLIVNYHIGGVVLSSANNNFTGPAGTLEATYELVKSLQSAASMGSTPVSSSNALLPDSLSNPIPLFIAISQEGDLTPGDQIFNGLTPMPGALAIGASWNKENAFSVGSVLGQELSSLGINLYLGPSLDVLDVINTSSGEYLGTKTFGGDPYWVGEMGRSFIRGIHQGSQWRMLVVSKNFPGRGGSDRPPDEEVATVRKSLEQLKLIELAPFFSVTGESGDKNEITDGLLISHIRYQGFQGNIRATTKPVSFDPTALEQILSLDPLSTWRLNGGILVSDNLGSQAVKRFFDPTGSSFDARMIANNAFLAGSDLLFVDTNFIGSGDTDAYISIVKALDFFILKYKDDPVFAEKVDESVSRLLARKLKLYPRLDFDVVIPDKEELITLGLSQQVTFNIARQAATLISPEAVELKNILPRPPESRDRIIFFTDSISAQQCKQCESQAIFGVDSLKNAVLKLYGQQASRQVINSHLSSYSFSALNAYLNDPSGNPELDGNLQNADWVVFSILDLDPDRPESSALIKFINSREELIRNKKILVFAFNAPYFLDATDISKISAYYGLYSKTPPFIDLAARILFQEHFPTGASPVSIPGIGYELITAMSPDPEQVIQITIDLPDTPMSPEASPQPTVIPYYFIGDSLPLRAGIIVDQNHHVVPDRTVVKFIITVNEEVGASQQIESYTKDGVARASYRINSPGLIQIRVVSEPALISNVLQIQVNEGEAAQITALAPTPVPTSTSELPSTQTGEEGENPSIVESKPVGFSTWLLAMILIWIIALIVYWIGNQRVSQRWGVRWSLCALIGGLLAYVLSVIENQNLTSFTDTRKSLVILGITILGTFGGYGLSLIWMILERKRNSESDHIIG